MGFKGPISTFRQQLRNRIVLAARTYPRGRSPGGPTLRWLSLMGGLPIPWAKRRWTLPIAAHPSEAQQPAADALVQRDAERHERSA
jgi:hypothetical protein